MRNSPELRSSHLIRGGTLQSRFGIIYIPVALRPNAGHGLLILEVSRPHITVGLLWTSDQLVAETSP